MEITVPFAVLMYMNREQVAFWALFPHERNLLTSFFDRYTNTNNRSVHHRERFVLREEQVPLFYSFVEKLDKDSHLSYVPSYLNRTVEGVRGVDLAHILIHSSFAVAVWHASLTA